MQSYPADLNFKIAKFLSDKFELIFGLKPGMVYC